MKERTKGDQEATRKITVSNILISHFGQSLNCRTIDDITAELLGAMIDGPTAWAFGKGQFDE